MNLYGEVEASRDSWLMGHRSLGISVCWIGQRHDLGRTLVFARISTPFRTRPQS
jgi:hypothetical protein